MRQTVRLLAALSVGALSAAFTPLSAQLITAVGYTATPGQGQAQGGSYNYFDDGGTQLTDGVLGVNNWAANLGNGNAQEWVGWLKVSPSLLFTLPSYFQVTQVRIGFNNSQSFGGIYLPVDVTINGAAFALAGNEVPSGERGWVSFSTNVFANQVQIDLEDRNNGRWIFVDEVEIYGTSTVPEPSSFALLLAGASVTALLARRRRASH